MEDKMYENWIVYNNHGRLICQANNDGLSQPQKTEGKIIVTKLFSAKNLKHIMSIKN